MHTHSNVQVAVPLPDVKGRGELIDHYLQDKPFAADVDRDILARQTQGEQHTHSRTHRHIHTHAHTRTHTHTYTHKHSRTHRQKQARTCIHIQRGTLRMCTHTHTYIHTRTLLHCRL